MIFLEEGNMTTQAQGGERKKKKKSHLEDLMWLGLITAPAFKMRAPTEE